MIFIFPLIPIIVAIVIIAFALFGEFTVNATTISNVVFVITIIIFSFILISNLINKSSWPRKIFACILTVILGAFSSFLLKIFVYQLGTIELSPLGLIEFILVGFIGGCFCLLIVLGCINLCIEIGDG